MYRDFYRLSAEPFRITPDPDFLFLTEQYREALAAIIYGIAKRKGFVSITGEVGLGKTTILRSYLQTTDQKGVRFIYVFNPNLPFATLLRTILRELDIEAGEGVAAGVERLHHYLIEVYRRGETVVLLIDEAHNMPIDTLENLRMLSNLETTTDKLIQIVLVGQPELDELLARPQLRQLRTRIAVHARLQPLTFKESVDYIRHRLSRVARDREPIFTERALRLIARHGKGTPRLINTLSDLALMSGFGLRQRPVTARTVRDVIADMGGGAGMRWPAFAGAAALVLVILGLGWMRLDWPLRVWSPPQALVQAPVPRPPPPLPEPERRPISLLPQTHQSAQAAAPPPAVVAPAQSKAPIPAVTRTVRQGDTLTRLVIEVYGYVDAERLDLVQRHNPELVDIHRLYIGQVIQFPQRQTSLAGGDRP